jgi:hypothetical protein
MQVRASKGAQDVLSALVIFVVRVVRCPPSPVSTVSFPASRFRVLRKRVRINERTTISPQHRPKCRRSIGRSVVALLAGMFAGILLSVARTWCFMPFLFFLRGEGPWSATIKPFCSQRCIIYRTIYGVFGRYLTARLAPIRPMQHALILGILGLAVCILGAATTWNAGPAFGPHWYPVALIALAVPTAWVGGQVRLAQRSAIPTP